MTFYLYSNLNGKHIYNILASLAIAIDFTRNLSFSSICYVLSDNVAIGEISLKIFLLYCFDFCISVDFEFPILWDGKYHILNSNYSVTGHVSKILYILTFLRVSSRN